MRVLVTGGAGFIGSQIVADLAAAGHQPVVFDVAPPPEEPWSGVEWIEGDVRDQAAVQRALRDTRSVCHQAAKVGLGKDLPTHRITSTATTGARRCFWPPWRSRG